MAIDFSDLGAQPVTKGGIDFSDLGAVPVSGGVAPNEKLRGVADRISSVMRKIDNPGGGPPAGTNVMEPKGNEFFERGGSAIAEGAGRLSANKNIPESLRKPIQYGGAALGTLVALGNPENAVTEGGANIAPASAEEAATNAARRSLGFTKTFLNKPGGMERANQVARTALDEGLLKLSPQNTKDAMEAAGEASGESIGNTVSTLSNRGVTGDTRPIIREVRGQLSTDKSGGLYDKQNAIAKEIEDTIAAHGVGPSSLQSLQDLKEKLGSEAKFNKNTDAGRAEMYRRAYGIVNKAIEDTIANAAITPPARPLQGPKPTLALPAPAEPATSLGPEGVMTDASIPGVVNYGFKAAGEGPQFESVEGAASRPGPTVEKFKRPRGKLSSNVPENVASPEASTEQPPQGPFLSPEEVSDYLKNKRIYGDAQIGEKALTNRLSSDEGNNRFSLTDYVLAAGKDPGSAAAQVLIKKGLGKYGNAFVAKTMDYISKNANMSQTAKQAAATAFLNALTSSRQPNQ